MPKLKVDGIEVEVPPGATVLQACEAAGKEIPRFCYHERLSIAGNCRMCLVEMEKSPKPIASCAMPAGEGMVIRTDTPVVRKARNGVMEFLLLNHPLDCPICDQGGECDLQDQAMAYGYDHGRSKELRRAVRDKDMGPLVKTVMTRCIHCTRCIRFATEVAGVETLGAVGRGEHMEITTYLEQALASELSGNVIDLCPVGALTSKPYAFTARSWELRKTESVDVLDAVGAAIRIDSRGGEVMRILPRLNEAVNEEWLADKSRFACDGLKRQRLDRPYIRENGRLREAGWGEALALAAARLTAAEPGRVGAIAGDLCDTESMFALKALMGALGVTSLDCRQDGAALAGAPRAAYLFNTTIAGIEQADAVLFVGCDPRREAPLVAARLRKRWLAAGLKAWSIGPAPDLTFPVEDLGNDPRLLPAIEGGAHPVAEALKAAKAPMIVLGMGALTRPDGAAILGAARRLADACGLVRDGWNGFNLLHTAAARVGGLDLGFLPGAGGRDRDGMLAGDMAVVYLLGADELPMDRLGGAFVIYQGHHGDEGAHRADLILPGAAYTEKHGTYVNTEGRPQLARQAVFPPGEAREDWKIIRALSEACGRTLPFDDLAGLRRAMFEAHPGLAAIGQVEPAPWGPFGGDGPIAAAPFVPAVANYYMTDPISRCSPTMASCTQAFVTGPVKGTGTHG